MNRILAILSCLTASLILLANSDGKSSKESMSVTTFPYQSYLDSMGKDDFSPTIGNDGQGFNALSRNIRYLEIPDTLEPDGFVDSLLQYYNIALAYNTMAYDVGTVERYLSESDFRHEYADALDSINLGGISSSEIKKQLQEITGNAAKLIREGVEPSSQKDEAISHFYDAFNQFSSHLLDNRFSEDEFDPKSILVNYNDIHERTLVDKASFRHELLRRILAEPDFSKKCVLVREYAYSNYRHPQRNDKEVVAVIDHVLRANKYSPLLRDLWRMWRLMLQMNIFGSRSNDSAIYNLFYNDMRNRIALVYIFHLNNHPDDTVALKEFIRLAEDYNIVRNSECMFGNNANLEDMELFYYVLNPGQSDDESE